MKKTFAIILSLVMLFSCISFVANAVEEETTQYNQFEGYVEANENTFSSSGEIKDNIWVGRSVTIPKDVKIYVPAGKTIVVAPNASLTVALGAQLTINAGGSVSVLGNGSFIAKGVLEGSENISVGPAATAVAEIRFPSLESQGLMFTYDDANGNPVTDARVQVKYASSTAAGAYEDILDDKGNPTGDKQVSSKLKWTDVSVDGMTAQVPLNQYLFVKVTIIERPEEDGRTYDKYDDSKITVYFNGVSTGEHIVNSGAYHNAKITTGMTLRYTSWSNNDSDFYNTFKIHLPSGDGYKVVSRQGEVSDVTLGKPVEIKYDETFAFRVEIDPTYDMSEKLMEVYIFNGYGWTNLDLEQFIKENGLTPAVPNEYGYYVISNVREEHHVYVQGVMSNETLSMVGNILSIVKNVFEMIQGFFAEIVAMLGLNLGATA